MPAPDHGHIASGLRINRLWPRRVLRQKKPAMLAAGEGLRWVEPLASWVERQLEPVWFAASRWAGRAFIRAWVWSLGDAPPPCLSKPQRGDVTAF